MAGLANEGANELPAASSGPKRRRKEKLLSAPQAGRALYVDVETLKAGDGPPVLLGLLFDEAPGAPTSRWVVRQYLLDACFLATDLKAGAKCEALAVASALGALLDLSDTEKRHVVSWSQHDRKVIQAFTGGRSFRYRNALRTARKWRSQQKAAGGVDPIEGPNKLATWERLVEYPRPPERFGVGDSIRYIRELSRVTPGAVERWQCLLQHNRHDLLAMRAVLWHALGLPRVEEGLC